jgi:GT2 family glycosyltransferase
MILDDLGIIVIGRNEGERLIGCLGSVRPHTKNLVYVDSCSTDSSVKDAGLLGAAVLTLDLTQPFTAARARNAGFWKVKSMAPEIRYVQFVDGDCVLIEKWLDSAVAFLERHHHVAIVCGRRCEQYPGESVYNELCDLEWDTPIGETTACGGDSLVRVEPFEAAGGFDPLLIAGEEPELCVRLRDKGWKIWRLDEEMTQHDARIKRFSQWWVRSVRAGYAFAQVSRLHWASPSGIWRRETARAIFWGGLLPIAICLVALLTPAALCAALVYPIQVMRIASARGLASSRSWIYGLFVMVAKFAEFQGVLRFYWHHWRRKPAALIEYK